MVGSAALSFVVAIVTSRQSARYSRRSAQLALAVSELGSRLTELEDLVVQAHPGQVQSGEFVEAFLRWHVTWQEHRWILPPGFSSVGQDVRSAVGEFTGAVAASSYDRRARLEDLADYSWEWQSNAERYIAYVQWHLRRADRWRVRPPLRFDPWLRWSEKELA